MFKEKIQKGDQKGNVQEITKGEFHELDIKKAFHAEEKKNRFQGRWEFQDAESEFKGVERWSAKEFGEYLIALISEEGNEQE
ncbi:MAG: hypothetical protein Ta2E_10110 [Mycoplasmoidaceae bacterium]|nr:MAG: hypothetical protein Ta2E_10110 [Mycoplasmoidaceae bacterium]